MFYRCQRFTTNQYKDKRKGSKIKTKEQSIPKAALVWRTGLSGVPPDNVRCTREIDSELASSGNLGGRSAIIHRTVWCASGATATSRQRSSAENNKCSTVRACARRSQSRRQKAHWTVYRTCPVDQKTEAPTVRIQRLGDVAGALDCPVRHATEAIPNSHFGGWGYKYPNHPHIQGIQAFTTSHSIQEQYTTLQDTNQSLRSNQSPQFNSSS
jgi:hypothetical protein